MVERHTRIRAAQISSVLPDDLESTNVLGSGIDGYLASYDLSTEKFTWLDPNDIVIGGYDLAFDSGDLSSSVLTVTHNLGKKIVTVTVYDNSDEQVIPTKVTATSTTVATVDLTDFTVTGTWNVRVH